MAGHVGGGEAHARGPGEDVSPGEDFLAGPRAPLAILSSVSWGRWGMPDGHPDGSFFRG